jgi:hypothetical protein
MIDGERIDALARLVAGGVPRRRLLGGLTAGLAAPLLEWFGARAAACNKVGRPCERNADCCEGARCGGGECVCKAGFDQCAGRCYDLDADEGGAAVATRRAPRARPAAPAQCADPRTTPTTAGACGNACGAGQTCCEGTCVNLQRNEDHCGICRRACSSPFTCCGGDCVTLQTHDGHCGACNNACAAARSSAAAGSAASSTSTATATTAAPAATPAPAT